MLERYAKFWIFRKVSGNSFPTTFCVWFLKKKFLMLYSINWPNVIVWMPLLHEILGNMCIAIACFASFDVINFQINLTFLIKPFFNMTKMSRPKLNILRIKRAFKVKWKAFFIMSKRFSFAICAFNKNIS